MLTILNGKDIIAPINHKYITLIMKIEKLGIVIDFRPITCVYGIHRIVAKIIANRHK